MTDAIRLGESVTLYLGDCLDVMATMDAHSVDSIVTDPPYGLSFMGKDWDHGVPGGHFWVAALRVAKPGAHLLAFGGTRTHHRLMCAIEDAGWEIRDVVMWVYAQGFPKSLDVSKAIDKAAGEFVSANSGKYRSNAGLSAKQGGVVQQGSGPAQWAQGSSGIEADRHQPATPDAAKWQGWGTNLKPSFEPVIVARKPLIGTVVQNVLEYGTGAINIDGCRVGRDCDDVSGWSQSGSKASANRAMSGANYDREPKPDSAGRWPANVCHDGSDEVTALMPNDAQRYFYCAKASKRDRNSGLDSTYTVKYNAPVGGALCRDVSTALAESLRRVMSESTVTWSIGESGASITGLCPADSLSTTLMAISRITPSTILRLWTPSLISAFTQAVSCETASGGSPVTSAENSSASMPKTGTYPKTDTRCMDDAERAISELLSQISDAANWKPSSNIHSTVKPTALMRWLVRLVTPPGGVVLDPFMGSGSTGKAAALEGFSFIGIDLDAEYLEIARRRIEHAQMQPTLDGLR